MKFSALAFIAACGSVRSISAFAPQQQQQHFGTQLSMSLEKYADELKETAAAMIRPGYGLLACDELLVLVWKELE